MTPMLRPNPTSGRPVYLQLVEQVKGGLEAGTLRPGDALPMAEPLAEALVISPNTVARAYRALETEGLLTLASGAVPVLRGGLGLGAARPVSTRRIAAAEWDFELRAAREVQDRLLPEQPAMTGVDCAGSYRPALGVGGDYYDFLQLSDTRLGLAIGDVSGKGPAAALLMATLRAYLHASAPAAQGNLAALMATLNRRVYESSAANRFASFFYAEYETTTRELTYVNAGHPRPLLLRANAGAPIAIDGGGPVIGMITDCRYQQTTITLEAGDVLVAFTDGVTEAVNTALDEWGDERLAATLAAHRAAPLDHLLRAAVQGADRFAAGAPQHDDMTLIAMRVA